MAGITRGSIIVGNASGDPAYLDANDDGKILVGDGNDLNSVAVSGDATLSNAGALTIAADARSSTTAPPSTRSPTGQPISDCASHRRRKTRKRKRKKKRKKCGLRRCQSMAGMRVRASHGASSAGRT